MSPGSADDKLEGFVIISSKNKSFGRFVGDESFFDLPKLFMS